MIISGIAVGPKYGRDPRNWCNNWKIIAKNTPTLVTFNQILNKEIVFFCRKQEGTEIFDGRKDHVNRLVMHYVEAPEIIATENYGETIDERTPNKDIVAEDTEKENTIPDTVVGFIGAKESQKYSF